MPLDWFNRRPAPSPELASALADLERLGRDHLELDAPAKGLAEILRATFLGASTEVDSSTVGVVEAAAEGEPFFRRSPPEIDAAGLAVRGEAVLSALGAKGRDIDAFRAMLKRDRGSFLACAHAILAGHPEIVHDQAEASGLDPSRVMSVLRMAMLPALAARSAAIAEARPEGSWRRGECPNCGDPPLLAESRGLEQGRFLRCGLCAGEWPADRLRCPSCGEADPKALTTLDVEGRENQARLLHCASCGSGLKVVSTLTALSAPALLVADLATVHLDFLP